MKIQRVFEIARELRVASWRLLEYLERIGFELPRNHMQPVTDEMYLALLYEFDRGRFKQLATDHPALADVKRRLASDFKRIAKAPKPVKDTRKVRVASKVKKFVKPLRKVEPETQTEDISMTAKGPRDVQDAFDKLLDILRGELKSITESSVEAIRRGDFERASEPIERAAGISKLLGRLNELHREWVRLFGEDIKEKAEKPEKTPVAAKPRVKRLPMGLLTPTESYFRPILQALVELGGKSQKANVVKRVEKIMAGTFTEMDRRATQAHPKIPRWKVKFDKVRPFMIKRGLLSDKTETGIWEITDRGKEFLAKGEGS